MIEKLVELMDLNNSPIDQYKRLGLIEDRHAKSGMETAKLDAPHLGIFLGVVNQNRTLPLGTDPQDTLAVSACPFIFAATPPQLLERHALGDLNEQKSVHSIGECGHQVGTHLVQLAQINYYKPSYCIST